MSDYKRDKEVEAEMTCKHPAIGDRATFTGQDHVFHEGQREGKTGTIVADERLEQGTHFSGGTCCWQLDGDPAVYITALSDLTILSPIPERLSDYRNLHYPVDYGFCSCGVFCETGTRFREHLREISKPEVKP